MTITLPDWHSLDFAELAWTAFAFLSLFVFVWHQAEPKLRAYVATTATNIDDEAVSLVGKLVEALSSFVGIVSLLVPSALSRGRIRGVPSADLASLAPTEEPAPSLLEDLDAERTEPIRKSPPRKKAGKAPPPTAPRKKRENPQKKPAKGQE